ncbi:5449_t:CDS:10, partial [Scutellospora calospora]
MPDFYHKIKDFQYYTWHITDWKNLEKRVKSPEFEAGGWKWQLLLFPLGNYNYEETNHIAIYLDFVDPQEIRYGWHTCVQFALLLWNQKEPTEFASQHTYHLFSAEELDWGFAKFCNRSKLFTPSDNRTHPLIENNSCNITVFVRIFENPTEYIGLKNQGEEESISSALQRIFYQLNISETSVKTTELIKFFGWNKFFINDVREFIRIMLDDLKNNMKSTKADGKISELFAGTIKTYIKCVDVDYEFIRVEDYYDIQLDVKGCKTLDESFMKYIQEETLDEDNKYYAGDYGLQVAKKRIMFESFPPVLHLQLKRFEYDDKSNKMVKLNSYYEFPMEIDLQKFMSPGAINLQSHKYLLHGVLVRADDCNWEEDRYFAFLKPENDHKWIKFDDKQVTPASINYGYEGILQSKNAYMLIYIRESNVDEILSPILPEEMPKHLQSRLDNENTEFKHNAEEIYLQPWVVTEKVVKDHTGFDLVNFDNQQYPLSEIPKFKILKGDTYSSFKKMIATKFKVPIDKIRFWVIVKRQNKTIRLDNLIKDDFLNSSMEEIKIKISGNNDLRLYMEILETPINIKKGSLPTGTFIIFIKYFNPDTQSLESLGQLYIQKHCRVDSIFPILCKKKQFPSNTPLNIYEEITPRMIKKMKPKHTFGKSNIQNGDIICFQKALKNKEILDHILAGRLNTISQFYELLSENIIVKFKSKLGYRDPKPEFDLVLNKNMSYEIVANQVATYLNTDPLRLHFSMIDSSRKINDINRTINQTLSEILQSSTFIYYE